MVDIVSFFLSLNCKLMLIVSGDGDIANWYLYGNYSLSEVQYNGIACE